MVSGVPDSMNTLSKRELEAQRLACSYLLKGCERSLFQFGLVAGETGNMEATAIDQRAARIMREVVSSWRETLSLLQAAASADKRRAAVRSWMFERPPDSANSVGERRFD